MSEPVDWMPDGTPYSPRFGDRYHSESGSSLEQARGVFLRGCGLPGAWAGQPQWRILETGFGLGLNFLVTWAAWRSDPQRCTLLHFVSAEAWPVSAADLQRVNAAHPELALLADELHRQWWGLLPGVHRLSFEGGRVLLTLYIGDAQAMLRQQQPTLTVDAVYLDGFSPQRNPDLWSPDTLKAVARCCRRGTRLATWTIARPVRDTLAQCGFAVDRVPGVPPKRDNLHAVYDPPWQPRPARPGAAAAADPQPQFAGDCIVIGAGIAGAAAAASLARRGWQVTVLDQGETPAAGASGLPAGVFAPHVSPDDSVLSRLSRSGVRTVLQTAGQLEQLLREGFDWAPTGVLEHRIDGTPGLGPTWPEGAGTDWSHAADADVLAAAGLPPSATACWHPRGGWLRPARLVAALLAQPGVRWRGGYAVATLRPGPGALQEGGADAPRGTWQVLDSQGQVLAEAPTVVLAGGAGSVALLGQDRWRLQPVRGQVSWAEHVPSAEAGTDAGVGAGTALPPFPVNGHGNLVPGFPFSDASAPGSAWVMGSTFERDVSDLPPSPAEQAAAHAANRDKLQTLLPTAALALGPHFDAALQALPGSHPPVKAWAAVRCTAPDRLPVVGPVDAQALPGLWVSTAMGARGLTLALLCAELLAARLQGEPLPLDARLARALDSRRL